MLKGIIYIFTNPSFPDYVKIGYTENVEQRLKDANSTTWTPFAFRLYATYKTDAKNGDKLLHKMISNINSTLKASEKINGKLREREFFKMSAEEAYDVLEAMAILSGTENNLWKNEEWTSDELSEDIESIEVKTSHSKRFDFVNHNIPVGSELTFKYDHEIKVTTKENNNVDYNGKEYSLSKLAKELLENMGYNWKQYQGPAFFCYKGKTLKEITKEEEVA